MKQFKFGLGQTVKNIIHGIKGSISGRSESLTGCRRYLLVWKSKDGKMQENWHNEGELKLVKDAPKQYQESMVVHPFRFPCGSKVRDMISGVEIIVLNRTQFSPGYNRYAGMMSKPKEQKDADHLLHFDEGQLAQVDDGIIPEHAQKVQENAQKQPAGSPRVEAG
jgi:hypothetical protein